MDKILHQVSSMADQLNKLTDAVSKFEKCKACQKKYYKSVDDANVSFEYKLPSIELTPRPSVPAPPEAFNSSSPPVKSSSTPLRPQKSTLGNQLQKPCNEMEASEQSTMLIGSPSRGVYVLKKKVEQLPKNTPKGFALKLFELVFSRDEAKTGSVEGKGEKLLKLDPNRIAAVKECTELTFSANENVEWATIKKCIDEKCRMVRNDKCFVWAGVNITKKE